MKRVSLTDHNQDDVVAAATKSLQGGGVVLTPTETSYGLAADAADKAAVEKVIALKSQREAKPISVIVADRSMAEKVAVFNPIAIRLWDRFMPGPLTIVLPTASRTGLTHVVTASGTAIGLRHPDHEFSVLLAGRFGKPYTATSANLAGSPPAYSTSEFLNQIEGDVLPDLVVDAGDLPIRPVSTVVRVTTKIDVLREGAIPTADIMKAAGAE